ncbi:MAG: hypothetical protein JEZ07_02875 [Phycisphaerae bacterium]|nr:hypothetical protein [Phycisphaerae bacterium]
MKHVLLTLVMLLAVAVGSANAASIAMNFAENAGNQGFVGGELIGPTNIDSANWNSSIDRDSGSLATGVLSDMIDDTGTVTTAVVSYASNNVWYNGDGIGSDQARLAVGYLDDGGGNNTFTVSTIPYGVYDAYVLFTSDNNGDYYYNGLTINGTDVLGGQPFPAHGQVTDGTGWVQCDGTAYGNYVKVTGLVGDLVVTTAGPSGGNRTPLTGFVIVQNTTHCYGESPTDGELKASIESDLAWTAPLDASENATFKVYFDPNEGLVASRDASCAIITTVSQGALALDTLEFETDYAWAVDTTDGSTEYPGYVWTFKTEPAVPEFITDIVGATVEAGEDVTLTFESRNTVRCVWLKDGLQIADLTDPEVGFDLTISDITQADDEGVYTCKIYNGGSPADEAISNKAIVAVKRLVARLDFEGNLEDSSPVGSWDGLFGDPNINDDLTAFEYDATDAISGSQSAIFTGEAYITIPNSQDMINFYPQGYTMTCWAKIDRPNCDGGWIHCISFITNYDEEAGTINAGVGAGLYHNANDEGTGTYGTITNFRSGGYLYSGALAPEVIYDGWVLVVSILDPTDNKFKFYYFTEPNGEDYPTNIVAASQDAGEQQWSQTPVLIGAERAGLLNDTNPDGEYYGMDVYYNEAFVGKMDDVRIYNYALTMDDIAQMYADVTGRDVCTGTVENDLNGDCMVDLLDFADFAATWMDNLIIAPAVN